MSFLHFLTHKARCSVLFPWKAIHMTFTTVIKMTPKLFSLSHRQIPEVLLVSRHFDVFLMVHRVQLHLFRDWTASELFEPMLHPTCKLKPFWRQIRRILNCHKKSDPQNFPMFPNRKNESKKKSRPLGIFKLSTFFTYSTYCITSFPPYLQFASLAANKLLKILNIISIKWNLMTWMPNVETA